MVLFITKNVAPVVSKVEFVASEHTNKLTINK